MIKSLAELKKDLIKNNPKLDFSKAKFNLQNYGTRTKCDTKRKK